MRHVADPESHQITRSELTVYGEIEQRQLAIPHAELRFGNGLVMVGSAAPGLPASAGTSGRGTGIYVVVGDVDAHHARARDAGADVNEPRDLGYTREYRARDLEGNVWHFGTYQPLEAR